MITVAAFALLVPLVADPSGHTLRSDQSAVLLRGAIVAAVSDGPARGLAEGTAIAVVDAPPARVFAVCTDYAHFAEFMPYTARSVIDRHTGDHTLASFRVDVPLLGSRHYQLEYIDGRRGVGSDAPYESRWRYTGVGDIRVASGSWQIAAVDGGARSLVRYDVVSDRGIVPRWIADRVARHAMDQVIDAVRRRAKMPK